VGLVPRAPETFYNKSFSYIEVSILTKMITHFNYFSQAKNKYKLNQL